MLHKKELTEKFKQQIIGLDFNFKDGIQGVYWLKEVSNSLFSISIAYKDYSEGFILQSPFASIRFHAIEDKINTTSNELGIVVNELDYTIKSKSLENSEFNYSVFETRIGNQEIFDAVFEAEKDYIQKSIFPFFEKYQDLNNVAELLSNLKPQEVVPYIQGAKLFCKTILILKETKHPKYAEKRDEYFAILKVQASKKEVYAEQLRLFELLFFTESI
jgi:hypothetical protein